MILDEFNIKYPKYSVDVWIKIYGIDFCENCLFEMIDEYEKKDKVIYTEDLFGTDMYYR